MSDTVQDVLEQLSSIFNATDEVLTEWSGDGNLQFPTLLGMLSIKMNWNEKQVREADPLVRFYIRRNSEYHVTRGAHGGIMRTSDKQKKEASKSAKSAVKLQMQAVLDAKVAQISSTVLVKPKDDIDEEDDDNLFIDRE